MRNTLQWIYRVYQTNRRGVLISLAFSILAALAGLVSIILYYPIFSVFTGANSGDSVSAKVLKYIGVSIDASPSLGILLSLLVGLQALRTFFLVLARVVSNHYEYEFNLSLKRSFLRQFTSSAWRYIIQTRSGRILNAFTTHTTQAGKALYCLVEFMVAGVEIVFSICLAVFVAPMLAMFLIFLGVIMVPVLQFAHKNIKRLVSKRIHLQNELSNKFLEYINGFKTFKSMSLEELYLGELNSELRSFTTNEKHTYRLQVCLNQLGEPTFAILGALFLLAAYYWFSASLESIIIFFALMQKTNTQIKSLQVNMVRFIVNVPSIQECDVLNHEMTTASENQEGQTISGHIQLLEAKDLSFVYPDGTSVFENVSFKLEIENGLFGVAGPSGVGKSTLIDILSGLMLPTSGNYTINGINIHNINLLAFRKKIGFVPQTPVLFKRSIKENISLKNTNNTNMDLIKECSKMADTYGFIDNLPNGYETVIGQDGANLSIGQIQRISIARALYQMPEILFFDEPTSALDKQSSSEIMKTITDISNRYPVIIISHDEKLFKNAHKLIKLDNKKIEIVNRNALPIKPNKE